MICSSESNRPALGDRVRLLGPQPQAEVRELLAASDLFVLACVPEAGGGSDNLPTVIMEAMAAGVPVLSTRLAGVPEMITHAHDGWLVAPRAPEELAAAIKHLLDTPALAAQLGETARQTARAKFAIAETTRALKHLLVRHAQVTPPDEAQRLDPDLPQVKPNAPATAFAPAHRSRTETRISLENGTLL